MRESVLSHRFLAEGRDFHRQFLDKYLPEKGTIGDIGCGYARIAAVYENSERRFISIDRDPAIIAEARRLLPGSDIRVGDAFSLPLSDESLDAYLGLGIFEADGERGRRAAREAARVTRHGGLVYLTFPYDNFVRRLGGRSTWRGEPIPAFSLGEVEALLDDHGFSMEFARPSSLAHAVAPFGQLAQILPGVAAENEGSLSYKLLGPVLRPFANTLLVIGQRR